MGGCPEQTVMVGIPGRKLESLWHTAWGSGSAGFQGTLLATGLLCDLRQIISPFCDAVC